MVGIMKIIEKIIESNANKQLIDDQSLSSFLSFPGCLRFNWLKIFFLSIGLMHLSACAVHKSSFDCPNGKGMGCGSMIDVHKAIKDNSFMSQTQPQSTTKPAKPCVSCQTSNVVSATNAANAVSTKAMQDAQGNKNNNQNIDVVEVEVSRSKDQIMRIWFNSYFDEYNNFHDSQYVYTIIMPAQWLIGNGAKS